MWKKLLWASFYQSLLKLQLTLSTHVSNNVNLFNMRKIKKATTQDFLTQYLNFVSVSLNWTQAHCSLAKVPHYFLQNSTWTQFLHLIYAYLHVVKKCTGYLIMFVLQVYYFHCILLVPAIIDLRANWVSDWSQVNRAIWESFSAVMLTKLSTCFLKLTCRWAQKQPIKTFNKGQCVTWLDSAQVKKD